MFKISSVHRVFVAALLTFWAGFDGLSQYNLTIEQSHLRQHQAQFTASTWRPMTTQTRCQRCLETTKTLVFSTPDRVSICVEQRLEYLGHQLGVVRFFPDLQDDSFATIGFLDGPAAMVPGAEDPSLVQDALSPTTVSGYFQAGGTELNVNTSRVLLGMCFNTVKTPFLQTDVG